MGYLPTFTTILRVFSGVVLVGLVSTAGLLYRYQTSLIYPASFPPGSRTQVTTPDEFDLPYEELDLVTPDGEVVKAFVMLQGTKLPQRQSISSMIASHLDSDQRQPPPTRKTSETVDPSTARSRPTILFLHANAGNLGHRLPLASVFFKRFGCNVFMLSYRGYGLSTGSPSEKGIRIDAQTALEWIKNHESLKRTQVVAYGQSIGGAVAVDLASRNPKGVHALILENTFLSIPELIPHVLPPVRPFAFLCREYWPTGKSIAKISATTPVLFMSGRKDELVPPSHMDALYERCSSQIKVWKGFEDGTHNDTCVKPNYFETISNFLMNHVVPRVQASNSALLSSSTAETRAALSPGPSPLGLSQDTDGQEEKRAGHSEAEAGQKSEPSASQVPVQDVKGGPSEVGEEEKELGSSREEEEGWVKMSKNEL
ncbi:alpha/beta-hydrolase [Violaceomyces palustris]|uniref:Alpha/beta-hydrolase n=1 Tax=Violaceomyces palustris TaxID=1673888 RepID=A0ACD0NRN5_9BASI|nr:alpha/beta-hydrolase [Violaceomyces palustris]